MRRTRTTTYEDAKMRRGTSIAALAEALNTSASGLYGIAERERWVETGKASRVGKRIVVHFQTYAPMIGFEAEPATPLAA